MVKEKKPKKVIKVNSWIKKLGFDKELGNCSCTKELGKSMVQNMADTISEFELNSILKQCNKHIAESEKLIQKELADYEGDRLTAFEKGFLRGSIDGVYLVKQFCLARLNSIKGDN